LGPSWAGPSAFVLFWGFTIFLLGDVIEIA
jgi:hypothetical protein